MIAQIEKSIEKYCDFLNLTLVKDDGFYTVLIDNKVVLIIAITEIDNYTLLSAWQILYENSSISKTIDIQSIINEPSISEYLIENYMELSFVEDTLFLKFNVDYDVDDINRSDTKVAIQLTQLSHISNYFETVLDERLKDLEEIKSN